MSSEMKSALQSTPPVPSATSGQAGMNGGPLPSNSDAQYIKTVTYRDISARPANVDGSFRDMFHSSYPGTSPASGSPRPGCELFSAQESTPKNPSY